jgi:hypothetical protein
MARRHEGQDAAERDLRVLSGRSLPHLPWDRLLVLASRRLDD